MEQKAGLNENIKRYVFELDADELSMLYNLNQIDYAIALQVYQNVKKTNPAITMKQIIALMQLTDGQDY